MTWAPARLAWVVMRVRLRLVGRLVQLDAEIEIGDAEGGG